VPASREAHLSDRARALGLPRRSALEADMRNEGFGAMPILQFSSQKPFPINKSTVSNPTGSKRAYTAQVSCREAAVHNGRQFKRCGLNVMRRKLVRAEAAVSRRENETRKIQLGMLCLSCTSIGNGD